MIDQGLRQRDVIGLHRPFGPAAEVVRGLLRGAQYGDLELLRRHLRHHANPVKYPDRNKGMVAPGVYPSRRSLHVECEPGQILGWVQAIMQYCTFVPGRDMHQELRESPLIYKLEIAVVDAPPVDSEDTAGGGSFDWTQEAQSSNSTQPERQRDEVGVRLHIPESDRELPLAQRRVVIYKLDDGDVLGTLVGGRLTADGEEVRPRWEAHASRRRVLSWVRETYKVSPDSSARVHMDPHTPQYAAVWLLHLFEFVGFTDVRFEGRNVERLVGVKDGRIQ